MEKGAAKRARAPSGVFLDAGTVDAGDVSLAPLEDLLASLTCHDHTELAERVRRCRGSQVVISNKCPLDAETLEQLPDLELILVAATGTDHVDLQAAQRRGIVVCNARNYATTAVVQHCLMLMFALAGRLGASVSAVRSGDWSRGPHFCLLDPSPLELAGRRLGIIGHGTLGQAVAEQARALGMEVMVGERRGEDPRPGRLPFGELIERCEVVSLHCPLTENTQGLIDAEVLARMPRGALLINTARGGLVDAPALLAALEDGRLGGAGIDVVEPEPPPADHPLVAARHPNLIVTAHRAWASPESRQRLIRQLAESLAGWLEGRPLRAVTARD